MSRISKQEYVCRLERIQNAMAEQKLDVLVVYGDEYRKENLRYVCNFWPIFERAACFIPAHGQPIVAGAPEGEKYAREMSVWSDVRNVKDFACVSGPEESDYPQARFSSFKEILSELLKGGRRVGLVGLYDMPMPIHRRLKESIAEMELVDAASILQTLRIIKSPDEIACLREAGRLACLGYRQLIANAMAGRTECHAAGAAEGAARSGGAEAINFVVFGSGPRTDTVIGRATQRVLGDGDMVMAALAVQVEGYVATAAFPFVIGRANDEQKRFLDVLFDAAEAQYAYLKSGAVAGEMVQAVKAVFCTHGMERYDLYPPMHGIGLAEAESPYPDASAAYSFQIGMCVNSDISLFGHPVGSNRIEEGFVIGADGAESITPFIRQLCQHRCIDGHFPSA